MPLVLFVPSKINLRNAGFYFFYWSCNVVKVKIEGFFRIWVELVMLYTHDYAHCVPRIKYPKL